MDEELKPCPFCGDAMTDPDNALGEHEGRTLTQEVCPSCGAMGPEVDVTDGPISHTEPKAIEAWNRRVVLD